MIYELWVKYKGKVPVMVYSAGCHFCVSTRAAVYRALPSVDSVEIRKK